MKPLDQIKIAQLLHEIAKELMKGDDADIRWLRDQAGTIREAAFQLYDVTSSDT